MTPPENVQIHDFPTTQIWFDEDGIFYSISKPNIPAIDREGAIDYMNRLHELLNSEKVCMIFKVKATDKMPKRKDSEWVMKELEAVTTAMAIVYDSPLGRMVANVYFGIVPGKFPIKFFGNVEDAKTWMKQYLNKI